MDGKILLEQSSPAVYNAVYNIEEPLFDSAPLVFFLFATCDVMKKNDGTFMPLVDYRHGGNFHLEVGSIQAKVVFIQEGNGLPFYQRHMSTLFYHINACRVDSFDKGLTDEYAGTFSAEHGHSSRIDMLNESIIARDVHSYG